MWQIEVRHDGLNRYRVIRGSDKWVVEQKAAALQAQWAEIWAKQEARDLRLHQIFTGKDSAIALTEGAQTVIGGCKDLLSDVLARSHVVDWASLQHTAPFDEPAPSRNSVEIAPDAPSFPPTAKPQIGLIEHLIPALKRRAIAASDAAHARDALNHAEDMQTWKEVCAAVQARNAAAAAVHAEAMTAWQSRKDSHSAAQSEHNAMVEGLMEGAGRGDGKALPTQVNVALTRAGFPEPFRADFEVEYPRRVPSRADLNHQTESILHHGEG